MRRVILFPVFFSLFYIHRFLKANVMSDFFVRVENPFFCKQPAVSRRLNAESKLDIRRLRARLQAANGLLRSSTQVAHSGRRLRVFGLQFKDHVENYS